jgi:hypothetical protein
MRTTGFKLFLIIGTQLTFGFSPFLQKSFAWELLLSPGSQSDQQPTWLLQKVLVKGLDRDWEALKKPLKKDCRITQHLLSLFPSSKDQNGVASLYSESGFQPSRSTIQILIWLGLVRVASR